MSDPNADVSPTSPEILAQVHERVRLAAEVVIISDYDGTLQPLAARPELAKPDPELKKQLSKLAHERIVYIVSGRDHLTLDDWLGDLEVGFFAEHGYWHRSHGSKEWVTSVSLSDEWKEKVRPILDKAAASLPGSFVEEKHASMGLHYRLAEDSAADAAVQELLTGLEPAVASLPVEILMSSKLVDVRQLGADKGDAFKKIRTSHPSALIVCLGDDRTDEDMFVQANKDSNTITIHIGVKPTAATYRLHSVDECRTLLHAFGIYEHGRAKDESS